MMDRAVIIQARMSSHRFRGKMLSSLSGQPLVEYIYKRCSLIKNAAAIVATSVDKSDDILFDYCQKRKIRVFRGELEDVLKRFVQAAAHLNAKYLLRVGGDTPLVDTALSGKMLEMLVETGLDYISVDRNTCASGFYSEAVRLEALKRSMELAVSKEDREHVTKYILEHKGEFSVKLLDGCLNPYFVKDMRLTVDYPQDLNTVELVLDGLKDKIEFTSWEVLDAVRKKKDIA